MPAQYDAIKKSEMKSGKSEQEAKRIAAATFNKNRKSGQAPVTRNYEKTKQANRVNRAKHGLKRAFPSE